MRRMLTVLASWLVLAASVHAQVKDDGGFFSVAAVNQANSAIENIKRSYKKDVQVETFKAIPANLTAKAKTEGAKFFDAWAQNRAGTLKVDGVYVLICKEPTKLEVVVDNNTAKKAFPPADREKLTATFVSNFKDKAFDKGLTEAVAYVRLRLEQNLGPAVPSPALNLVADHAKIFSAHAVTRTNAEIKEFKERFKKDLIIETFSLPPPDRKKMLDGGADKNKVFGDWLAQREQSLKADGIHVLICKDPPHIQIGVADKDRQKIFRDADRDQLVQILVANFKAKDFDKGLSAALDFVYDTVDRNVSAPVPAPASGTILNHGKIASAVSQAQLEANLKALKKEAGYDVLIETFTRVPPGMVKQFEAMSAEARGAFISDWQSARAKAAGNPAIAILLVKEPLLRVQSGFYSPPDNPRKNLSAAEQNEATAFLMNKGLDAVVAYIRDTLSAPPIKDDGGFFSAQAVEKGNASIRAISRRYQKKVLVETLPSLSAFSEAKNRIHTSWPQDAQKELRRPDIYILACREPMTQEVGVRGETESKAFTADDRDQLVKAIQDRFRDKNFDGGLTEGLTFTNQALQRNVTAAQAAKSEGKPPVTKEAVAQGDAKAAEVKAEEVVAKSNAPAEKKGMVDKVREAASDNVVKWVLIGVAGLIGLWVLIGIIRALTGAGRPVPQSPPHYEARQAPPPAYPQQGPGQARPAAPAPGYGPPAGYGPSYPVGAPPAQGGGGGGFLPSLMGGMFGAAAGGWLYNRMSGGGSTTTVHQHYTQGAPPPSQPAPPAGPGYTSSGGDFGQPASPGYTSSGGDFGAPDERGQYATSGGDFGAPVQGEDAQDQTGSTGADWGGTSSEPAPAGGDGGTSGETDTGSSGGDWGGDQTASNDAGAATGGDWGSPSADTGGSSGGVGGDSGGGGGGGDWSGGSSGGDAGGGSTGGDWSGGGGDSGG